MLIKDSSIVFQGPLALCLHCVTILIRSCSPYEMHFKIQMTVFSFYVRISLLCSLLGYVFIWGVIVSNALILGWYFTFLSLLSFFLYYSLFLRRCTSSDINHNFSSSLGLLFSFYQLSLALSWCLFLCHRSMCFTAIFSYPTKTHLFNLGPHRHSLGQNSCEDKVRVRVISTSAIGKRQRRRRKRIQWPSGSLTRLSIIPGLQRELRERKKQRDASVHSLSADHVSARGLPTL